MSATRLLNDSDEDPFNEMLSVFYLQKQKMNWHDDGEDGVGPVVASLSLCVYAN